MKAPAANVPPALANWLGFCGLIPFAVLALALWWPAAGHQAALSHTLAGYGATIASFLGAIHWGLAMRDRSDPGAGPYLWGVAPSLLAWLALLLPPAGGLLGLAVLLGVCLLVDQRRYPRYQLQAWLPLRRRLTLVASLACLAGAAGLLR
jgi:uncharacterized membrane protein HdeD (DUF308 family)